MSLGRDIMRVLRLSRPLYWIYTGGLFVLGALVGAVHSAAAIPWNSLPFLAVLAWFAFGENFFGVLLNDYNDRDIDARNPRKLVKYEDDLWRPVEGFIVLSSLAFGILATYWGGSMLWTYGFAFFAVNICYNVPPVRLKERPPFDLLIGAGCALPPLFAGYSMVSHAWPPLWAIAAGILLFVGFELFDKIFDAQADAAAGITTTAVWLGLKPPSGFRYRAYQWGLAVAGTIVASYLWYLYFS